MNIFHPNLICFPFIQLIWRQFNFINFIKVYPFFDFSTTKKIERIFCVPKLKKFLFLHLFEAILFHIIKDESLWFDRVSTPFELYSIVHNKLKTFFLCMFFYTYTHIKRDFLLSFAYVGFELFWPRKIIYKVSGRNKKFISFTHNMENLPRRLYNSLWVWGKKFSFLIFWGIFVIGVDFISTFCVCMYTSATM